jgi:NarL family two-component system response regulator LiaR
MTKTSPPIRLLIAEDHEFTRTGLIYSFQKHDGYKIVGEAENGKQAIKLAHDLQPDMVLMDIGMPDIDGISATREIKDALPAIKVIILTSRQFSEEIYAVLSAGADAYCMKDISTERLLQVLEVIADGAVWLDPAIARIVASALPQQAENGLNILAPRQAYNLQLTEREVEVLHHIAMGKSNKDIAEALQVSVHTIKSHVRSLIQKLAVDDRTQAAVKALQDGLI